MKHNKHFITIFFVLIFGVVFLTKSNAQNVYDGDLTLSSQDEVNAFNYTEVTGYFLIAESVSGNIVDLTPLNSLISVGGYFSIYQNDALTSIDGLQSLTSVGENFAIIQNDALINIDELQSLTSVGAHFSISYNTALMNLDGLQNLTSVGGDLVIQLNDELKNLDGLQSLTSVGGGLWINHNASLTLLTNLDGLHNLRCIHIDDNTALTNLDGLESLTSVDEWIWIANNTTLKNIDGLESLTSVGWYVWIGYNSALTNLDGLRSLTSVGILTLSNNTVLVRFCGIYTLLSAGSYGTVIIVGNGAETTVDDIIAGGVCTAEDYILTLKERIIQLVNDGVLNEGQGTAFISKLDLALLKYDNGNFRVAKNILISFINQVNSFITEGILTEAEGQELISAAEDIIEQINNSLPKQGIDDASKEIPVRFTMEQNYPNPFNPNTTIKYQIPKLSSVTLKVYDVLGNEIATLINEEKQAGTYKLTWNAENLPSGVYIYRIQAGVFIQTKKMILMR